MSDRLQDLAPGDDDGPVFAEAWQADVFAITQVLIDAGELSAGDWMSALTDAIADHQAAGDPDLGDTYYEHWLAALEAICERQGLASAAAIDARTEQWRSAYVNTPHGEPVELSAAEAAGTAGDSPANDRRQISRPS